MIPPEERKFFTGIVCGENIELIRFQRGFLHPIINKDLYDAYNVLIPVNSLIRIVRFVGCLFLWIKNGLFTVRHENNSWRNEKRSSGMSDWKNSSGCRRLRTPAVDRAVFITEVKLLLELIEIKNALADDVCFRD
jgi:hypothetical protein